MLKVNKVPYVYTGGKGGVINIQDVIWNFIG